jgi:hypothetical protein
MATVFLTAAELKGKRPLPRCCLVCGRRRARLVLTDFHLRTGLFGTYWSLLISPVTILRYLRARVPLCSRHRRYFADRQRLGWFLLGVVLIFLLLIVLLWLVQAAFLLLFFLILLLFLFALAGGIGLTIFKHLGVHVTSLTRKGMQLANVSERFADALEDLRQQAGEEEDECVLEGFSDDSWILGPFSSLSTFSDREEEDDEEDEEYPLRRRPRR